MQIVILGKSGCRKCEACKDKMERMQLSYEYIDLENLNGWRHQGAARALAAAAWADIDWTQELPVVVVGDDAYRYAAGMRALKGMA